MRSRWICPEGPGEARAGNPCYPVFRPASQKPLDWQYENGILPIPLEFEFDVRKSAANKEKHGIDFVEAQALWDEPVLEIPARVPDEERKLVIGRLQERFWTAIVTERGEKARIISVRRARKNEEDLYKTIKDHGAES